MSDIFLSHVEEDAVAALRIALGLEMAGYATWCYEIDSVPGPSYLLQTGEAIETSQAVLLLVSSAALDSHQITPEIGRAHETRKPIIPVLCDVTHEEFQKRAPVWRQAVGTATSIHLSAERIEALVSDIVRGLEKLEVHATRSGVEARIALLQRTLTEHEEKSQTKLVHVIPPGNGSSQQQTPLALPHGSQSQRKQLRKEPLLLILLFVVTALVLAPLALIRKSVRIEGTLTVSQCSFVIGPHIPANVFSGVTTTALTIHGLEKVDLHEGVLETVATRDPQSGTPLTWRSVGKAGSASLVPTANLAASVTFPNATLNELTLPSRSPVTLRWLPQEPHLLSLRIDDQAITGRIAGPPKLQFSCNQCQVVDNTGHEEVGEEWRIESDRGHVVKFVSRADGATLGFELDEKTPLKDDNRPIPITESLAFTQLRGPDLESTLISEGKIEIVDVKQEVTVRPGDFVVLDGLRDFLIRTVALDNGIQLSFHGMVGELRTGTKGAIKNRLPSVLEWIYPRQTLLLYLSTVIFIGTTIVAILGRFNVLRKEK